MEEATCKNPYCNNSDITSLGFCSRCYRLTHRNGVMDLNNCVPAYGDRSKITIDKVIKNRGMSISNFCFKYKVSFIALEQLHNEVGASLNEFLVYG